MNPILSHLIAFVLGATAALWGAWAFVIIVGLLEARTERRARK